MTKTVEHNEKIIKNIPNYKVLISKNQKHKIFEHYFIGFTAIIASFLLIFLAISGPLLGFNFIEYKTSQSAEWQTMAQDFVNLVLVAPLTFIGAMLHLRKSDKAKYFLSFTAIYTMLYQGFAVGLGMEWGNSAYTGNSEKFFGAYLFLIIYGLVMIFYVLSQFNKEDSPEFNTSSVRIFVIIGSLFLFFMSFMWLSEILEVISTGDTSTGSYSDAPNVFWLIRYLDLGFTIPLGFISFYLFYTRTKNAYPYLLLFFGFFVTLATSVNCMGWLMFINNDPGLQMPGLFIFAVLLIVSLSFYLFLILPKVKNKKNPIKN